MVEIKAIGVNTSDFLPKSDANGKSMSEKYVPGKDAAGVVVKVGKNVKSFKVF